MVLEKLAGITDALDEIDDKARGGPIEAASWNALVGAVQVLVDIVRDQDLARNEALKSKFAPADHGHEGEITERWLEPALAARLEGAGGLTAQRDLSALSRQVKALSAEVARLRESVESQRREVDRFAVGQFDTRREVESFQPKLDEIDAVRLSLDGIDGRLGAVSDDIAVARELSARLTDPSGNPIDIAALSKQIEEATALRDAILGVDGDILRMRDLELRLRQVEDLAGLEDAGNALDDRFAVLRSDMQSEVAASVADADTATRTALQEDLDTRFATVAAERESALDAFRNENQAQIAAARTAIEAGMNAALPGAVADATAGIETRLKTGLDARFAEQSRTLETQVMTAARTAVAPLRTEIAAEVLASTEARIDTRTAALSANLDTRLGAMDTRLAALDNDIADAVETATAETRGTLETFAQQEIARQTAKVQKTISEDLRAGIGTAVAEETADLSAQIDQRLEERFAALDGRLDSAVNARLAGLEETIAKAVDERVAKLDIDARFATMTRAQQDTVASAVASAESRLRADQTRLLNENAKALRTEIETARLSAINEATVTLRDRPVIRGDGRVVVPR